MLTILLIKKIIQLFLYILMGYLIVRTGILKPDDSKILSKVMIYILVPASTLSIFQVEVSDQILHGMFFGLIFAAGMNIFQVLFIRLLKKPLHLTVVEQASSIYPNAVNLIIPLVSYMLGEEWLIYVIPYMTLQTIMMFTHAKSLFSGEPISIRSIVLNIPIICTVIGFIMMIAGIQFPDVINIPLAEMKSMLGPFAMLIAGMLIAGTDMPAMIRNRRIYLVLFLRMLLTPAVILVILVVVNLAADVTAMVPDGRNIILIPYLAACAPAASLVTQFAQLYNKDARYASAINIITTLSCILTMPVMVFFFEHLL